MKQIQIPKPNETNLLTIEIEKSMTIVGANGAGKTRFGSRIEQVNSPTKRISAQRYLQISEVVPNQDYDTSVSQLNNAYKHQQSIIPQNDYVQVLMSLFAEESKRNEEAVIEIQSKGDLTKANLRPSVKEQLLDVWSFIYPDRNLKLIKNKIRVSNGVTDFSGIEMSDGEKVGLYLISQILLADINCILIIDEPELHLHKALMVRLWNKLEEYRKDCAFIYITHDLDFAVSKNFNKLVWIKNYVSEYIWDWEEIVSNTCLPENLFLEVLGSRKPILFVEGDKGSLDAKIYQAYYENLTIIPCGSCEKVIEAVRSLKAHPQLIHITINGLIDKDFRPAAQLANLQEDGIFSTQLCEIENIFLAPEIIEMVCNYLYKPDQKEVIENEVKLIYAKNREQVVFASTKYLMHRHIGEAFGKIKKISDYETIKNTLFNELDALIFDNLPNDDASLIEILKHYPNKGLTKLIQTKLSQTGNGYIDLVLGFLSTDKRQDLLQALRTYLPTIPVHIPTYHSS